MDRRTMLTGLGLAALAVTQPQLGRGAEPRGWAVPLVAIKMLELRPTEPEFRGLVILGEDGRWYKADDVMRGILTYMFSK